MILLSSFSPIKGYFTDEYGIMIVKDFDFHKRIKIHEIEYVGGA